MRLRPARENDARAVTECVLAAYRPYIERIGRAAGGELLLENVAVHPSYQHKGLGAKLLAHAEAEALRRGFGSLCLYTNEKMTENRGWYARLGYQEFERRNEDGFERVYMRKTLT